MVLWNARCLTRKISQLGCALIGNRLDIVVITETWIKCKDDPIISELSSSMSGYVTHQRPRAKRRGGDVAVIVRSNLVVKEKRMP